ncbi:MAG: TIGR00725 family protein [Thermotogota bacterium]
MKIGVIGYSGDINIPKIKRISEDTLKLGELLAKEGHHIFNGGRDGIMELVSKGAKKNNGLVTGILPWDDHGNDEVDFEIKTGLDFSMRSFVLLKSVDVVISIGGEVGTGIEILGAYSYSKPLILLKGSGGWTDRIIENLIDGKFIDNRRLVEAYIAKDVEEIMKMLKNMEGKK